MDQLLDKHCQQNLIMQNIIIVGLQFTNGDTMYFDSGHPRIVYQYDNRGMHARIQKTCNLK